jgi:nucleoside-diphosphate-sugar epimerase
MDALRNAASDFEPDVIIHFPAQAGVRYSIDHPRTFVDAKMEHKESPGEAVCFAWAVGLLVLSFSHAQALAAEEAAGAAEPDKARSPELPSHPGTSALPDAAEAAVAAEAAAAERRPPERRS